MPVTRPRLPLARCSPINKYLPHTILSLSARLAKWAWALRFELSTWVQIPAKIFCIHQFLFVSATWSSEDMGSRPVWVTRRSRHSRALPSAGSRFWAIPGYVAQQSRARPGVPRLAARFWAISCTAGRGPQCWRPDSGPSPVVSPHSRVRPRVLAAYSGPFPAMLPNKAGCCPQCWRQNLGHSRLAGLLLCCWCGAKICKFKSLIFKVMSGRQGQTLAGSIARPS